jgi:hypothetical protein
LKIKRERKKMRVGEEVEGGKRRKGRKEENNNKK